MVNPKIKNPYCNAKKISHYNYSPAPLPGLRPINPPPQKEIDEQLGDKSFPPVRKRGTKPSAVINLTIGGGDETETRKKRHPF